MKHTQEGSKQKSTPKPERNPHSFTYTVVEAKLNLFNETEGDSDFCHRFAVPISGDAGAGRPATPILSDCKRNVRSIKVLKTVVKTLFHVWCIRPPTPPTKQLSIILKIIAFAPVKSTGTRRYETGRHLSCSIRLVPYGSR